MIRMLILILYQAKEAMQNRAHTAGFHICEIQIQAKVIYSDKNPK